MEMLKKSIENKIKKLYPLLFALNKKKCKNKSIEKQNKETITPVVYFRCLFKKIYRVSQQVFDHFRSF